MAEYQQLETTNGSYGMAPEMMRHRAHTILDRWNKKMDRADSREVADDYAGAFKAVVSIYMDAIKSGIPGMAEQATIVASQYAKKLGIEDLLPQDNLKKLEKGAEDIIKGGGYGHASKLYNMPRSALESTLDSKLGYNKGD